MKQFRKQFKVGNTNQEHRGRGARFYNLAPLG